MIVLARLDYPLPFRRLLPGNRGKKTVRTEKHAPSENYCLWSGILG